MSDKGYIFYPSFHEAMKDLPAEQFKECQLALNMYALFGEEVEMSPVAKMFFNLVKPQIDANNRRYENGKKGGRPKKDNQTATSSEPKNNQTETKPQPKANVEPIPLADGTEWKPDEKLFEEYKRLYPAINIESEFRKMRSWCLSNPSRRKTKAGVKRFVNNWLQKTSGDNSKPNQIKIDAPDYIIAQMNGTLPAGEKASAEDIARIKKMQEEMKW